MGLLGVSGLGPRLGGVEGRGRKAGGKARGLCERQRAADISAQHQEPGSQAGARAHPSRLFFNLLEIRSSEVRSRSTASGQPGPGRRVAMRLIGQVRGQGRPKWAGRGKAGSAAGSRAVWARRGLVKGTATGPVWLMGGNLSSRRGGWLGAWFCSSVPLVAFAQPQVRSCTSGFELRRCHVHAPQHARPPPRKPRQGPPHPTHSSPHT